MARAAKAAAGGVGRMAKTTLEGHFARGTIAIAERRTAGFARVYDLAERVVPNEHHTRTMSREDAQRELIRLAARANGHCDRERPRRLLSHGAARGSAARGGAGERGELREVPRRGLARAGVPALPDARVPRAIDAAALLSPFDPVIWYRPRAERLFEFDYRIEIYVPREKRKYGYYVLPFLLGDRFVGRVDLKADRDRGMPSRARRVRRRTRERGRRGAATRARAPNHGRLARSRRRVGRATRQLGRRAVGCSSRLESLTPRDRRLARGRADCLA